MLLLHQESELRGEENAFFPGSFGADSGVDECIERVAESINYAHSRVEKVITGIGYMLVYHFMS